MRLRRVISGGQTGADRAALNAAAALGYETGGTAAPQYTAKAYALRSQINVDNSDATVAFRTHASSGTDNTIGYALTGKWASVDMPADVDSWEQTGQKPVLVIIHMTDSAAKALQAFLIRHAVETLNVAGHRMQNKQDPWQSQVEAFLLRALDGKKKRIEGEMVCLGMNSTGTELVWLVGSGARENWREATLNDLLAHRIHVQFK